LLIKFLDLNTNPSLSEPDITDLPSAIFSKSATVKLSRLVEPSIGTWGISIPSITFNSLRVFNLSSGVSFYQYQKYRRV